MSLGTVRSSYSVEAELVAFNVLHHEAGLVLFVGREQAYARCAECNQALAFGLKCSQTLFTHEPLADTHVEMYPVLDDLAFGNPLEEQSRAHACWIDASEG